jgi:hypothetical protein
MRENTCPSSVPSTLVTTLDSPEVRWQSQEEACPAQLMRLGFGMRARSMDARSTSCHLSSLSAIAFHPFDITARSAALVGYHALTG